MRKLILPALVAGAMGISAVAFAATTTTEGVLKSVDMANHQITLADGTVIKLPAVFADPGLKAGEKVSVTWQMAGNVHQAESVKIVQ